MFEDWLRIKFFILWAETDHQLKKMLSQDSLYKHLAEEELPLVIMLEIKEMLILTENSEDTGEGYWDINDTNMEKEELLEKMDGMAFR